MDTKSENTGIMILTCTAVVLLVVLSLVQVGSGPSVVLAGSMQDRGGDYSATVARLSEDQEAVWILDCRNATIGIYQYDISSKRLELRQTFTLEQVRAATR